MQAPLPSSSSAWFRGVVQMFASQGVDAERLFRDAGLDIGRLKQAHARFDLLEAARLWELAVAQSGNPALGMDRQLAVRYVNFDLAAQAMWPGKTLQAGLTALSRYLHLVGDSSAFDVQPQLRGAWLVLAHGGDGRTPRQRMEFGLLSLFMLCRRVTHRQFKPEAVDFVAPDPPDFHPYRMAFACPLRFGQPANRMLFSDSDLALPLASSSASLFALHDQVIEDRLGRSGGAHTSFRASEEIVRRLHLGEPGARQVAQALGLAEGQMDRRLRAEGTSLQRLLDEVRRELAGHYLADPAFPLPRLPSLLGFADPAAFTAACRRWFGMAPAPYRQALHGVTSRAGP